MSCDIADFYFRGVADVIYLYIVIIVWVISQLVVWLVVTPYYKMKYALEDETVAKGSAAGTIHLFANDRYYSSTPENPFEHSAVNWATGQHSVLPAYLFNENDSYKPALAGTVKLANHTPSGEWLFMILDNGKLGRLGLPVPPQPNGIVSAIGNTPNPADAWSR